MRSFALFVLLAVVAAMPVAAQTESGKPPLEVGLRSGDHRGFGRVVVDLPPGARASLVQAEGRVLVHVDGQGTPVVLAAPPRAPRNVSSITVAGMEVAVGMVPGAALRTSRLGNRLVLDIADALVRPPPSPGAPATVVALPRAAAAGVPTPPDPTRGQAPDARYRAAEEAAPARPAAPVPLAPPATAPAVAMGLAATPPAAAAGQAGAPAIALTLPFAATTGAAALRRNDLALVVFDERRALDLSRFRSDPVFGTAAIVLLPGGTLLRLKLPADRDLRLARGDAGWTVTVAPSDRAAALRPIRVDAAEGRLRLAADAPGQVVAVPDPLTGGTLLVGTQREAGQGMPIDRRTPEFALLATFQGVAVLPRSDSLALRAHVEGFVLAAEAGTPLVLSATDEQSRSMVEAARASRRYDLPQQNLEALHRRLQSATLAAATAPPQARTQRRREVAEALLALGMGAEMQAVIAIAMAEDARAATDPDIVGLAAIAAMLAGRAEEAVGIEDPRLTGTDEIALWRAVRAARQEGGSARAASVFASAMPLLQSYPTPLRDRLLPLALETMAQGGEAASAMAAAARLADQPGIDIARGYLAERAATDPAEALAHYDRVAEGTDRRARARALRRAVELRLSTGALTQAQAADALERLLYAWRGDEVEVETRLRIAELRAGSGAYRAALTGLREMRALFPEKEAVVRARLVDVFASALAPELQATLTPFDVVSLAEENADLMPTGETGLILADRLAEWLTALDLPERAVAVMERLVADAPPGVGRAAMGDRLAALRLQQGHADAALAVLGATVVEGPLPPTLLEGRTLNFARASALSGDVPSALAALAGLGTPAALDLRLSFLEQTKDWPAATAALAALAATNLPESGPLDPTQARLVLRLASAAAQAGDTAMLTRLREVQAPRLPTELRALLQVMVAAPVNGVGDLPRAAREARLARGVPVALRSLSGAPTP